MQAMMFLHVLLVRQLSIESCSSSPALVVWVEVDGELQGVAVCRTVFPQVHVAVAHYPTLFFGYKIWEAAGYVLYALQHVVYGQRLGLEAYCG